MNGKDNGDSQSVALYWDFENLHASLLTDKHGEGAYADSRFKAQEPLVDVQAVVELAASFGPVAINRAYCNWQSFHRYRGALLENAVELIQLFPPGASAKNGADIKLCLDATEDIGRFAHIGTVVIVGGDSDFMPVAQKIKAAGRTLIGIGTRNSTNRHWAKSCHEFRYYENLVEQPIATAAGQTVATDVPVETVPPPVPAPEELLKKAVRLLSEGKGEAWVNKASIGPMIKRLDSTFDTREHGFASFSDMIKAHESIMEIRRGSSDHEVKLRE